MSISLERIEQHAMFGGTQEVWRHRSSTLGCDMRLGVFLPERAKTQDCPVLYWLSGLTCSEQNFITKAGAQRYANQHGIILVAPDTSPRGNAVADDSSYDLGQGAGHYVNATQSPWRAHYRMYYYVTLELPALLKVHFPVNGLQSISGHSVGGHGALLCGIKNASAYRSVSAFSPVASLQQSPWGERALTAYLGSDRTNWAQWDVCELLQKAPIRHRFMVDIGGQDEFLHSHLKPELLQQACVAANHPLDLSIHAGYDHSYYFIASFIERHILYHAQALSD
jgi:S-formylglutathione hydrolase